MDRVKLISAVQQCCDKSGYSFRVLGVGYLAAQAPKMAAALLEEPIFLRIEGRNHGRITYSVVLHLLDKGMRNSPEKLSEQIAKMESDMLEIMSQLSVCESIAQVSELNISPTAHTVLGRGEVGVTARAEVEVIF